MEPEIHQKSKNNAISAYLMLFISGLFIFNKSNEYINNNFVKSHTKVAFLIHISFLLNYIVFISFDFLKNYAILWYSINYILASAIFTLLFVILLFWIYKASQSKSFKLWDFLSIWHKKKIIDINWDNKLDEKDKLTLILAHIPFIWYIVNWKYYKNPTLKNIVSFNLLVSFIITLIYIMWYKNVSLILLLPYIIFTVFSSINIVKFQTIFWITIDFIPMPENKINNFKALLKYIKNYFWKWEFIWITKLKFLEKERKIEEERNNDVLLNKLPNIKIPKILIYIPIVNIITIFFTKTKQKFHIINWLILTLIFIILLILNYYYIIDPKINLLLLFPIFFWIWYIDSRLAYKMPFVFDIFELLNNFRKFFIRTNKKVQEIKNEMHEQNIKVWENIK